MKLIRRDEIKEQLLLIFMTTPLQGPYFHITCGETEARKVTYLAEDHIGGRSQGSCDSMQADLGT